MNEFQKAYAAHKSVHYELKEAPCILRVPPTEILHALDQLPFYENSIFANDFRNSDVSQAIESLHFKFISQNKTEPDFQRIWFHGGDHELLQNILKSGQIPTAWCESWSPERPRSVSDALGIAKQRGYSVPDEFLDDRPISYSESEAWHAAYLLVSNNFHSWRKYARESQNFRSWRSFVCQLTCQFIIPDPFYSEKTPYIADQLWIVAVPQRKARFIILEIDGENHLEENQKERDLRRDMALAAMGYEVYHASGWWCRIDPYRVICEFLNLSGIFPDAHHLIVGHQLNYISDYFCDLCGKPMIRWDYDWISEVDYDGNQLVTHRQCADEFYDNL